MRAASKRQIETWDKRRVSIHEAGHAVVASVLGAKSVSARIFKEEFPEPNERTWGGYTEFDSSALSALRRAATGISGEMAEWYSDLEADEETMWEEWHPVFINFVKAEMHVPSPSDWEMIGVLWKVRPRVVTALAGEILFKNWKAVKSVARWLRSKESIFDEEIRMLVSKPESNLEAIPFEQLPQHPSLMELHETLAHTAIKTGN